MANLLDVAWDMQQQAKRTGLSTRELRHGLRLELAWVAGMKTLVLSRPAILPSDKEVQICRGLFDVPSEVEQVAGDVSVTMRWPSC